MASSYVLRSVRRAPCTYLRPTTQQLRAVNTPASTPPNREDDNATTSTTNPSVKQPRGEGGPSSSSSPSVSPPDSQIPLSSRKVSRDSISSISEKQLRELKEVMSKSREQLFEEADRHVTRWENMKVRWGVWWQETKHHYIHGTKELGRNIKLSCSYASRALHGHTLSRRERRLMSRTLGDVFRVVPFSMFVVIPFMEFLLPVALKIFPNMLPSTYDDPKRITEKYQKRLSAQVELAKFMQDTLEEMAVQVKKKSADDDMRELASGFADFMISLRKSKEPLQMSYGELKALLPLFNQDLGLTKMRRPQLLAMCRLLETPHLSLASEESLRIGLRMHLRRLKRDDILIEREGLDSLTDKEVIGACKMRAIRVSTTADVAVLRKELALWVALSRQPGVSNSMLLFSRVLPIDHIRMMATEAARDYGKKQVEEIETRAELKSHEDDSAEHLRNVHNEWQRVQRAAAANTEEDNTTPATLEPGVHLFMLSYGEVARLRRKEQTLRTIAAEMEGMQDIEDEIGELKEESLEFTSDDTTTQHPALGQLGKRIQRSIAALENRLRTEETDVVVQRARSIVQEEEALPPGDINTEADGGIHAMDSTGVEVAEGSTLHSEEAPHHQGAPSSHSVCEPKGMSAVLKVQGEGEGGEGGEDVGEASPVDVRKVKVEDVSVSSI